MNNRSAGNSVKELWWIPDENEVWTLATQVSDELPNGCVNFQIHRNQKLVTLPVEKCLPAPSSQITIPEDLVYIPEVNPASILSCIRTRFTERKIYTNIGMVLMSVNPFEIIPGMYGKQKIDKYINPMDRSLPAHVYVIASRAFYHLCQSSHNQSILISGESGAGKTEATKQCLSFLADLANRTSSAPSVDSKSDATMLGITDRILFASPILEAFGNAKTLRNNNSSRFGKWMVLNFDQHNVLHSSNIVSYLLEKSRVTQRDLKERNYHIFYQVLRGVDPQILRSWNIARETKHYRFLQTDDDFEAVDLDDHKTFQETYHAFVKVGFSPDETMHYMRIVAAILQLGNVIFSPTRDGEACDIRNPEYIEFSAQKLGVNPQILASAMCSRSIESGKGRKSIISIHLNAQKAQETRDTLARSMYEKLFHDIIDNINSKNKDQAAASTAAPRKFIGLLDIFGFEIFVENSFEQLCINYCNEMLQYHFNFVIFTSEKNLYAMEGIYCETIEFRDNIEVIKEIEHVFKALDEEARIPKGTSKTWFDKLKRNFKSSCLLFPTRRSGDLFVVKHYAGDVDYTPLEFMDKNIEVLNNDLLNAMVSSKDPLVFRLFTRSMEPLPTSIGSSSMRSSISVSGHDSMSLSSIPTNPKSHSTNSLANKSISWRFINQLNSLMTMLKDTQSHFIRCIKSNDACLSQRFDSAVVFKQLTYSGIFEVVKIQQSGLPCRLPHSEFLSRYRCLASGKIRFQLASARELLKSLQSAGYELGRANVGTNLTFFSSSEQKLLETNRDSLLDKSSKLISRTLQMITRRFAYRFIRLHYREFQIHNAKLDSIPATAAYHDFCASCERLNRLVMHPILEHQIQLMKKHLDFLDARVELIKEAEGKLSEKSVPAILSLNEVIAKAIELEITNHAAIVQCRTILQKYNRTLEFLEIVEQTKLIEQQGNQLKEEAWNHALSLPGTEGSEEDSSEEEKNSFDGRIGAQRRRMTLNHLTKTQLQECIASLSEFKDLIPDVDKALQSSISHQQLVERELQEIYKPLEQSFAKAETLYDSRTGDITLKYGDDGAEAYLALQQLSKQHETTTFKGKDCATLFEDCRNFIRLMEDYVASNDAYEAMQFIKSTSLGKSDNPIFVNQLPQFHRWAEVQMIPQSLREDLLLHNGIPKSDIASQMSNVSSQLLENIFEKLLEISSPSEPLHVAMTVTRYIIELRKAFIDKSWKRLEEIIEKATEENITRHIFDDYPSCYDELHNAHWQITYHTFLNDLIYSISDPIIQSISFDLESWIVLVSDLPEDLSFIQEIKLFANPVASSKLLSLIPLFELILQLRSLLYSLEIPFVKNVMATLPEEHAEVITEFNLSEKIQLEFQHCEKLIRKVELEGQLNSWILKIRLEVENGALTLPAAAILEARSLLSDFSVLSPIYTVSLTNKLRYCELLISWYQILSANHTDKENWIDSLHSFEDDVCNLQQAAANITESLLPSQTEVNLVEFDPITTSSSSESLIPIVLDGIQKKDGTSVEKPDELPEKEKQLFVLFLMHYQIIAYELFRRYLQCSLLQLASRDGVLQGTPNVDLTINRSLHCDSIIQLNEITQQIDSLSSFYSSPSAAEYRGYSRRHALLYPKILLIKLPMNLQRMIRTLHRHFTLRQLIVDGLWETEVPLQYVKATSVRPAFIANPMMISLVMEIRSLLCLEATQDEKFALFPAGGKVLIGELDKIALEQKARMITKCLRYELENIKIENVVTSSSSMRKISINLTSLKSVIKQMDEFPQGDSSKKLLQLSSRLIRLIDFLLSNQIERIHQRDLEAVVEEYQDCGLNSQQIHQIFHQVQIHNFLHELNEIIVLFKDHHHNLHLLLKSINQLHKNLQKIMQTRQSTSSSVQSHRQQLPLPLPHQQQQQQQQQHLPSAHNSVLHHPNDALSKKSLNNSNNNNHNNNHFHQHHWKCLLWLKAGYYYCALSSIIMQCSQARSKHLIVSDPVLPHHSSSSFLDATNEHHWIKIIEFCNQLDEFLQIYLMPLFYEIIKTRIKQNCHLQYNRRDSRNVADSVRMSIVTDHHIVIANSSSNAASSAVLDYTEDVIKFMELCIHLTKEGYQLALVLKLHQDEKQKETSLLSLSPMDSLKKEIREYDYSTNPYSIGHLKQAGFTNHEIVQTLSFDAKLLWAYNVDLHIIKRYGSSHYSSRDLLAGGYTLKELYNCGFTPAELYESSLVSIQDLLNIGLSITQLRESGIPDEVILKEITDFLRQLHPQDQQQTSLLLKELKGFSLSKLLSLGYKLNDLQYFNFSLVELRAAGFTPLEICHYHSQRSSNASTAPALPEYVKAGFPLKALLAIFPIQEFRKYNYSFEEMRRLGVDNDEDLFAAGYVLELEYEALSALYQSTHGAFWKIKTNWNNYQTSLNEWFGVSTVYDAELQQERVQTIELINNNLRGFLPVELCNLKKLRKLRLSLNNISSDVPVKVKSFLLQNAVVTDFMKTLSGHRSLTTALDSPSLSTALSVRVSSDEYQNASANAPSSFSPKLRSPPLVHISSPLTGLSFASNLTTEMKMQAQDISDQAQLHILKEFYHSLNGRNWKRKDNWLSEEPIVKWYGVRLNTHGKIIEINLASNNLQGTIPTTVNNLPSLKILDLRLNQIHGFLPPTLSECSLLEKLFLQSNKLCGHIPESFKELTRLKVFDVRSNLLDGVMVNVFLSMNQLQYVGLHSNKFSDSELCEVRVVLSNKCKVVV